MADSKKMVGRVLVTERSTYKAEIGSYDGEGRTELEAMAALVVVLKGRLDAVEQSKAVESPFDGFSDAAVEDMYKEARCLSVNYTGMRDLPGWPFGDETHFVGMRAALGRELRRRGLPIPE